MKKSNLVMCFMTVILSIASIAPVNVQAKEKQALTAEQQKAAEVKANLLLSRLYEIDEMDKSTLTSSEKRKLRVEVRTIKSDLKNLSEGIYLSVGAIIIIILLLILLL